MFRAASDRMLQGAAVSLFPPGLLHATEPQQCAAIYEVL